jgi:o-succinylbenzoate synthase
LSTRRSAGAAQAEVPAPIRDFARGLDPESAAIYSIPMATRFRGITVREGLLLAGPAGWGDFCPFAEYDDDVSAWWLATALEAAVQGWPAPLRQRIPINVTVPAVDPQRAHAIVTGSGSGSGAGAGTAKVKVADHPDSLAEDLARLEAVRDALGPAGAIRIDPNAAWDVDTAVRRIAAMNSAAGGLEYVEQPCRTLDELAAVRRRVGVRIAADESIRGAADPLSLALAEAVDLAVIKCTPLGGVRRSLQVAEAAGLPCVVSSALETSVGLAAQLALAGALPQLDFACGLGTRSLLHGDVVDPAVAAIPVGGYLAVPLVPPTPDPALLDRYRLADPERRRWWTDRLRRTLALLIDNPSSGHFSGNTLGDSPQN